MASPAQRKDEILIMGGGPSGLLFAHELLRRRVPVRVIEKRQPRDDDSCPFDGDVRPHGAGQPARGDLSRVSWRYLLLSASAGGAMSADGLLSPPHKISQNDFEQALCELIFSKYSTGPEYRTELEALEQDDQGVTASIRLPDGAVEKSVYPHDGCPIDDLFMNCTKMPGKYWRIYMSEPTGEYFFAPDQQKAYQEVADKLGIGFKVGKPHWQTAWDVRNNIAEKYRNSRLIICGDASHVHSPSGGQDMNGCMQDAFNLGWKLAAVFKGQANDSILDSYEKERKPIGSQISKGAMATHEIVMGFGIPPEERLHLTQESDWEWRTINLVSGLSHNYRDVVNVPVGLTPVPGPQAGERAPRCASPRRAETASV
ncbi:Pentachlorophenol monooxygenase [Rasamsonia emersonii CBS 393.64]|uniref:Pentachlorophenol monooxygenase n=1 Tax=Rasamsonia emersonii (strain ATCC 16479 / CBS 393.64 / IMI 116815) TaxID=1408163 RepID=A0A0F4Z5V7_RASE3|nr:Pentachlorophenol monooxygenase [Rasamsonia emersonii CBS 393.64]KKA25700.1 Pentachlorophenol monooxygenase [Rasamsonia emersonii CBS 393.64]